MKKRDGTTDFTNDTDQKNAKISSFIRNSVKSVVYNLIRLIR